MGVEESATRIGEILNEPPHFCACLGHGPGHTFCPCVEQWLGRMLSESKALVTALEEALRTTEE